MAFSAEDFKSAELYQRALRREVSQLRSGPQTKVWVYRDVEMPAAPGRKMTFRLFFVFYDPRVAQPVLKGKSPFWQGLCGTDSGRIMFQASSGKVPFDALKASVPALFGKPIYIPRNDGDPPPNYTVDVNVVKKLVVQGWAGKRLVKVVSAARGPQTMVTGYVTLESSIAGRDPAGMARNLGLPSSDVAHGVYVMRLTRLPAPADFELRGYTQLPQGREYKPGAKIDYPPGSGVPQWKLIRAISAEAVRGPDGKPRLFRAGEAYRP